MMVGLPPSDWVFAICFTTPLIVPTYLGFFHHLPDLIGGATPTGPIYERWSNWLRDSGLVATFSLLVAMVAGWKDLISTRSWVPTILITLVLMYAVGLVMTVFRRDCAPCPVIKRAPHDSGWLWAALRVLGVPARRLYEWLRPPVRLSLGSVLVLASLLLVLSGDFGCAVHEYRGYEVLIGRGDWITAENVAHRHAPQVIAPVGRVIYPIALVTAIAALVAVCWAARRKKALRTPTILTRAAGLAAVFTVSDLGLYFVHHNWTFSFSAWCIYWVIPLGFYFRYARSGKPELSARWMKIRAALIVLYLPVIWMAYGMCIAVVLLRVTGFLAYFAGIQLLWWGLSETGCELAEHPAVVRPSPSASASGAACV